MKIIVLLLLIALALTNNLVAMPEIRISDIETPSFQEGVNKLIARYGRNKVMFDAIIEASTEWFYDYFLLLPIIQMDCYLMKERL